MAPESGQLLRAEISVEPGYGQRVSLEVSFVYDDRLGFAVPAKMRENYQDRNGNLLGPGLTRIDSFSGDATYSNYRKFSVETSESLETAH